MRPFPKKDLYHVAVIGAGAIGHDHIRGFQQHPAARVVAVVDNSETRSREAADKYGIGDALTNYQSLLTREDIDVISIALPNYLHARVGMEVLKAGKHLMLEKPMATDSVAAEKLAAEAKRRRRLLMVGQNMRFQPEVQTARQLIERGLLGEIYHAKTAWSRRSGIPRIGSWFTQKKYSGGGCLCDIGVHALDRALYLMGEFDAVSVSGQTFAKFGPRNCGDGDWGRGEVDPRKPFDVEDLAVALIRLRSGRTVLLESSWACHQAEADHNGTEIFGTKAGLAVPNLRLFRPGKNGYAIETISAGVPVVNPNRMVHFIDCLIGEASPFVSPDESVAVQRILDAIYVSARTGREVQLTSTTVKTASR